MAVGCGAHAAQIIDRDGGILANADVLTEVEWTRVLGDVSTARIVVSPSGDCCERLGRVRSWRHRLALWRNGEPVWEGPIVQPDWTATGLEIQALDIAGWLDRRFPHQTVRFVAQELTEIAAWLIADGFAPDDPGHTVEIVGPTRIRGDREYIRERGQTGDHLRDLAKTGLDWTVLGSRILLMPEDHCERVGSLTDADFPEGLTVSEDGTGLGTRWVVHGDEGVRGEAGGIDPYYGLLEYAVDEPSVLDQVSAEAAARSRLRASSPAPVWIDSQQVTLSPDAAVDVPSLVPGWCVDVTTAATCRRITQSLKIAGVRVTEDGERETVSVQLAPAGV